MPVHSEYKNNKNYRFYYDTDVNIKSQYDLIVNGSDSVALFLDIAKNLVHPDDIVLKSNNKVEEIKAGKNIEFDRSTGNYKSLVYGYVLYDGVTLVSVIPVINIEDTWRAFLVLPAQNATSKIIGIDIVLSILEAIPIKLVINYEGLALALKESVSGKGIMFTFVEGRKPVHGNVPKVVLDYDFSVDIGRETADGKIDFKERGFVHNVDEGVAIAHYTEELPSVDGLDIYNDVIFATYDKDECYKLGDNVEVGEDESSIMTTAKGVLSNAGNVLKVHNLIEVDKVDLSTGNINISGSVLIKENVIPGFTIQSEGDVIVQGNITDARIFASGNLFVSAGITGGSFNKIEVQGSVYAGFLSNVTVSAQNDVIARQILNSNIIAGNRVIAMDGKGAIIGGNVSAKKGIYAKVLGAVSGTPTVVSVGRDIDSENRIKEILGILKKNREYLEQAKSLLGTEYFRNPKVFLSSLSPDQKDTVRKILLKLAETIKVTKELNEERKSITIESDNLAVSSSISVVDSVFPGTCLHVASSKKLIDKKQVFTEFYHSSEYGIIMERTATVLDESEYNYGQN